MAELALEKFEYDRNFPFYRACSAFMKFELPSTYNKIEWKNCSGAAMKITILKKFLRFAIVPMIGLTYEQPWDGFTNNKVIIALIIPLERSK